MRTQTLTRQYLRLCVFPGFSITCLLLFIFTVNQTYDPTPDDLSRHNYTGSGSMVYLTGNDQKLPATAIDPWVYSSSKLQRNYKTTIEEGLSLPFQYTYQDSQAKVPVVGKRFTVNEQFVMSFMVPGSMMLPPSNDTMAGFVFVTGCSSGHFLESYDAIALIQKHFPDRKLYYFDWGLTDYQKQMLNASCNVEVRPFDFQRIGYMHGVKFKQTHHYQAAKVFVIMEILKEHSSVFWIDSSIKFKHGDLHKHGMFDVLNRTGGFALLSRTMHSPYVVTPPGVYHFLPTNITRQQDIYMAESGAMFFARTKVVYERILWWLLLCSTDPDCIFSGGYIPLCTFTKEDVRNTTLIMKTFHNCSRIDQSILNILLSNMFDFDLGVTCPNPCSRLNGLMQVVRLSNKTMDLRKCLQPVHQR